MVMRKSREEWDVYNNVFDKFTDTIIRKLQGQGYFDELLHLISLGKEGNVFLAQKGEDFVCVKIYRLQSCDFNRMYDYLKMDPKYLNLSKRRREVVFAWAQKEYRNLITLYEHHIKVPKPLAYDHHVLVMELIGDEDGTPAKQLLKEYPSEPKAFFDKIVEYMKIMQKEKMVHGDLSESNILNFHDEPVIIDVSQTTSSKNFRFNEYLRRDCKNLTTFFKKLGIETDEDTLFKEISILTEKKTTSIYK